MQSKAKTVDQYIAALPEDRREAISAVRGVILKNLPKGYEEGMSYGMIGYHVPHSLYPAGYHCDPKQPLPFAGLASQKGNMSLYLMCVYSDPDLEAWFREAWTRTGARLDMGKSCVRFKKLDGLPLNVIGQAIRKVPVKKFIAHYEDVVHPDGKNRPAAAKTTKKKTTKKKAAAKTVAKKKTATRKVASKPVKKKVVAKTKR